MNGALADSLDRFGRVDFGAPPGLAGGDRPARPLQPGHYAGALHSRAERQPQADEAANGAGWGVVIATSLPAFGAGLESWLSGAGREWGVAATCQTIDEALDAAGALPAIIVVATDELDGVALAQRLAGAAATALLLVLAACDDPQREAALARAGANGVLGMSAPRRAVLRAVGDVIAGRCVLSSAGVRELLSGAVSPEPGITARQREVLQLLADGLSTAEIAQRLVVTPSTVKTHITRLSDRFGLAGQRALAVNASSLLEDDAGAGRHALVLGAYGAPGRVVSRTTRGSAPGRW